MKSEPVVYSAAYERMVVLLLMTAYTFNAMDRTIISIIGQAMKLDLELTDTQLGLLGGSAFALLYAFGGIPAARLAERTSRVNIIAASLIVWSSLSALCGLAGNFPQMVLIRMGVGLAESGCSPPAHSLISDYFAPARRTSALSVYSCGTSLGYLLAAVAGGYVAQHWGWRAACALVGLPGIAVAVAIKWFIDEPARGRTDQDAEAATRRRLPPFSLAGELRELTTVGRSLLADPPVLHMVFGVTIGGFAAYGFYAFVPPYLNRAFDLGYATAGAAAGLAGGVAVGLGIVGGGFLADLLARTDLRWYALVPAVGGLMAVPFYLLALMQSDWRAATTLLAIAGLFQYASLGPTFGVVQNVVDLRRRATATALLYICLSVFALGLGPLFTGWVIDCLAGAHLQAHQTAAGTHATSFASMCPGGAAPAAATAAAKSACASALTAATRQGMQVMLLFFAWATVHYFLASTGLAKSLNHAAIRNAAVPT